MFREFAAPYLKRLIDICHSGGVQFMLHSCGSIWRLVPEFLAIGVDILDPIQTMAKGMEPERLNEDFGDRISFHGGIDVQSTLPFGSPEDVRAQVRSYLELTGKRGGYILSGSQSLIADIPDENILAMYDENRSR